MKKILLLACVIYPCLASADEIDCKAATSSMELNTCIKKAKESADTKLNASYKQLIARVNSQYQRAPDLGAKFLVKLKTSQLAWIKLRDANCSIEAFEIEEEMPAHEVAVNNCIAKMSLDRSSYLDKTFPDGY